MVINVVYPGDKYWVCGLLAWASCLQWDEDRRPVCTCLRTHWYQPALDISVDHYKVRSSLFSVLKPNNLVTSHVAHCFDVLSIFFHLKLRIILHIILQVFYPMLSYFISIFKNVVVFLFFKKMNIVLIIVINAIHIAAMFMFTCVHLPQASTCPPSSDVTAAT